jgi:heterodisulfide reductase subunit A
MKIGVFLCKCSKNIAEKIDLSYLSSKLKGVSVYIEDLLCSDEGIAYLKKRIERDRLCRVVIAGCTPRQCEGRFREEIKDVLNPYLLQIANIREQVAWVTERGAEEKALSVIEGAVSRVRLHKPLKEREIEQNTDVLVIGGGISGIKSATLLAEAGRKVYLIEECEEVGGRLLKYDKLFPELECASCVIQPLLLELYESKNIEVLTLSKIEEVSGFFGRFEVRVKRKGRERRLSVGAIVVATGFGLAAPNERFGHSLSSVITSEEAEKMLLDEKIDADSCVIINCVGRRRCYSLCCMVSAKLSLQMKRKGASVSILHSELCGSKIVDNARKEGVRFVEVDLESVKVKEADGQLLITHSRGSISADLVILNLSPVQRRGTEELSEILDVELSDDGFFSEKDVLNPFLSTRKGIFLASSLPGDVRSSIMGATAASCALLSLLKEGRTLLSPMVSEIDESICGGCKMCLSVCPYKAVFYDEEKGVCKVEDILCAGCGICVPACPSSAISLAGFTEEQVKAEVSGVLR